MAGRNADVLAHLRTVTRTAHNSVEAAVSSLMQPLSLVTYKNVIERFYGFWLGWQPQVAVLLHDEALLKPRHRLHMLAADLAALGLSVDAMEAVPRCPLTELHDDMEALGSLYVMEGSTLGGKIIQQELIRCLGDDAPAISSYFNGYGANNARMWRSFVARLEEESVTNTHRIGAGALKTFERFGWWIESKERLNSYMEAPSFP
jgi:heme oxygenase (biliverdin-IX-beta and delta-forming)